MSQVQHSDTLTFKHAIVNVLLATFDESDIATLGFLLAIGMR